MIARIYYQQCIFDILHELIQQFFMKFGINAWGVLAIVMFFGAKARCACNTAIHYYY